MIFAVKVQKKSLETCPKHHLFVTRSNHLGALEDEDCGLLGRHYKFMTNTKIEGGIYEVKVEPLAEIALALLQVGQEWLQLAACHHPFELHALFAK